jgi:hypothetical protein
VVVHPADQPHREVVVAHQLFVDAAVGVMRDEVRPQLGARGERPRDGDHLTGREVTAMRAVNHAGTRTGPSRRAGLVCLIARSAACASAFGAAWTTSSRVDALALGGRMPEARQTRPSRTRAPGGERRALVTIRLTALTTSAVLASLGR